jgi:trk system potassium uptake protein TrkH
VIEARPIIFFLGLLLIALAAAMLVPAAVDAANAHPDWQAFLGGAAVCLFFGGSCVLTTRGAWKTLSVRQSFVLTVVSWVLLTAFAALPFRFAGLDLNYASAFFEAMSGITTTGSTTLVGLDNAPPGVLLWRAMLQWLGGIGFVVLAIAVLPMLQVGGNQLFRTEFSDPSGKTTPRIASLAAGIGLVYAGATFACFVAYWAAGMGSFEAIAHAMTTIATGGFSTADASIGHFASPPIEMIATLFMIVGSLPFTMLLIAARGDPLRMIRSSQVQWFIGFLAIGTLTMAAWQIAVNDVQILRALRTAAFNVTSIITGTGYASEDYWRWGTFPGVAFLFFMFVGGCAGSTSCSVKIFRYQVLFLALKTQLERLLRPHRVYVPHYDGKPLPDSVTDSVFAFFFLFLLVFALLAFALSLLGLDFVTSVSSAATAITNVGPGLGSIVGPAGTFAELSDGAKWLLSLGMLLGRLEVFTVVVLFTSKFWRV